LPGYGYFDEEPDLTNMVIVSDGDSIITQPKSQGIYYAFLLDKIQTVILGENNKPLKLTANDKAPGDKLKL